MASTRASWPTLSGRSFLASVIVLSLLPVAIVVVPVGDAGAVVVDYEDVVDGDSPSRFWRLGETASPAIDGAGVEDCVSSGSAAFGSVGLITTSGDASVEISAGGKLDCGVYSFAGGSSVSLEGWFRADSLPSTGWKVAALAGTDSLYLRLADGFPELEVHTSTGAIAVQGSTRVAVGEAHHLVGTYDGSHVRIFVDGVLSAVQTKTGLLTGSGPFWIGKNSVHGYPFDGAIDEVAVYDSVLSPTQVTAHYQAGRDVLSGSGVSVVESRGGGSPSGCVCGDQETEYPVSLPFGEFWHTFESFSFPGRGVPLPCRRLTVHHLRALMVRWDSDGRCL